MKISKEPDHYGGAFYKVDMPEEASRFAVEVEELPDLDAFCCSYRKQPFFMDAKTGRASQEIPPETQWLGVRHKDGSFSVYFSIVQGQFRTSLCGAPTGISVVALTGDTQTTGKRFYAMYKISGSNFYALVRAAAASISEKFQTVTLREEKREPAFSKYFGWCTWDSFYDKVTREDIFRGLESFQKSGFVPKLLILDDGWQTVNSNFEHRGMWKLTDFRANEKFGGGLRDTVKTAKNEYGVEKFFVWHAVMGYWGGVDPDAPAMQKYRPRLHAAEHTEEIRAVNPERWAGEHFPFGIVNPDRAFDFYNDYHTYLKNEGVDGVKIDVQASLEGHGEQAGGRVALIGRLRDGLEASVCYNFDGEMINCMSCANDIIYHIKNTNMMRTSDDFMPAVPESHQKHIFTNAVNSVWMSQFTACDWDMFQTKHEYGLYHAAARAISGGPVYVSDKVDEHDFRLIRALINDEGELLLPERVAQPTADCLFEDIQAMPAPYKIFNQNRYGGVVGIFAAGQEKKTAAVSPTDVDGFVPGMYAAYSMKNKRAYILKPGEAIDVSLEKNECDVMTFAKIEDGFAVLGNPEKINSGGAVTAVQSAGDTHMITVNTSGALLLYCPRICSVAADGKPLEFTQDGGIVRIPSVPKDTAVFVRIR